MSFILDALRKAEHGRQRAPATTVPITAASVPAAPPDTSRRVAGVVAAVAVTGIAIVAWSILRPSASPDEAETRLAATPDAASQARATPAAAAAQTRSAPGDVAPSPARRQPVRDLDQEIGRAGPATGRAVSAARPIPAETQRPAITPGTVTILEPEEMAAAVGRPSTTNPGSGDADEYAQLPDYDNLLRGGRINMPNLSLDMHVYNREPEKRFVFINLRKYREGDSIDGRATVDAITPRGAVLNNNGVRFMLRPN